MLTHGGSVSTPNRDRQGADRRAIPSALPQLPDSSLQNPRFLEVLRTPEELRSPFERAPRNEADNLAGRDVRPTLARPGADRRIDVLERSLGEIGEVHRDLSAIARG